MHKDGRVNCKQLPMACRILPTLKTDTIAMSLLQTSQASANGTAGGFSQRLPPAVL